MLGNLPTKRNNPHIAPILYRIVHGTSSTSLNLTRKTKEGQRKTPLFKKSGFYQTIIYKYPNFKGDWPGNPVVEAKNTGSKVVVNDRPIETGIFIPMNAADAMGGGYAIYVRQAGYKDMLREYLGVDFSRQDMELLQDFRALEILDDLPSIDPFLVKSRFDSLGMSLPPNTLEITDEEERAMRKIIEDRVGPLLAKAFEREGGMSEAARARALDAIWTPTMPDSQRFVRAFGIHESECSKIFFALQGITFYEYLFNKQWPNVVKSADWLKATASPYDAKRFPRYDNERVSMLRVEVGKGFAHTVKVVQGIFREYQTALDAFLKQNSPSTLRQFLLNAHRHFWTLGHGIMAATNSGAIVEEALRVAPGEPPFELASLTLNRMRITLAHRGEAHRL